MGRRNVWAKNKHYPRSMCEIYFLIHLLNALHNLRNGRKQALSLAKMYVESGNASRRYSSSEIICWDSPRTLRARRHVRDRRRSWLDHQGVCLYVLSLSSCLSSCLNTYPHNNCPAHRHYYYSSLGDRAGFIYYGVLVVCGL